LVLIFCLLIDKVVVPIM